MTWVTHRLTPDRFEDFADVINPTRRSQHCWCVAPRLRAEDVRALDPESRGDRERAMRALCERRPPGIVAYEDDVPVGWANTGPRADIPRLVASANIRPIDDLPVWSIVCLVVRSGHRRQGVTARLIEGAAAWAAAAGAPAIEAYPVEPTGRMDSARLFVGTRAMFDRAGFTVVGSTDAVANGLPRLVMRRTFSQGR